MKLLFIVVPPIDQKSAAGGRPYRPVMTSDPSCPTGRNRETRDGSLRGPVTDQPRFRAGSTVKP
ncbi:hypothetical protein HMPREF0185_00711 [Brevundimonas diminuta 470-4]|nr:hypothetical protein HMPREF0185_00711 [Brevundimonas diminuta 470-4]